MSFTQECTIRKNTAKITDRLKSFGYNIFFSARNHLGKNLLCYNGICTSSDSIQIGNNGTFYDCGTNEDLFFALAALMDDSDYMQFFTDGKTWKVSDWRNAKPHLNDWYKYFGYTDVSPHKATVEELIEHFK